MLRTILSICAWIFPSLASDFLEQSPAGSKDYLITTIEFRRGVLNFSGQGQEVDCKLDY
jgi:hypothetical protein